MFNERASSLLLLFVITFFFFHSHNHVAISSCLRLCANVFILNIFVDFFVSTFYQCHFCCNFIVSSNALVVCTLEISIVYQIVCHISASNGMYFCLVKVQRIGKKWEKKNKTFNMPYLQNIIMNLFRCEQNKQSYDMLFHSKRTFQCVINSNYSYKTQSTYELITIFNLWISPDVL